MKTYPCPSCGTVLTWNRKLGGHHNADDLARHRCNLVRTENHHAGRTRAGSSYVACDREHSTPPWERCGCRCEFGHDRTHLG